jgi:hypothetical protein
LGFGQEIRQRGGDALRFYAVITVIVGAARHIGSTATPRREAGERTGGALCRIGYALARAH